MKKFFSLAIILFVALMFCRVEAAKINYGESEIYTRADMNAAIKIVKKQFGKWKGCKLLNIRYAGDEHNNAENIKWLNELAPAHNHAPNFAQCIMFLSDFYVSPNATETTFNLGSEYKNWQWWLARTRGGDWQLLTFGY